MKIDFEEFELKSDLKAALENDRNEEVGPRYPMGTVVNSLVKAVCIESIITSRHSAVRVIVIADLSNTITHIEKSPDRLKTFTIIFGDYTSLKNKTGNDYVFVGDLTDDDLLKVISPLLCQACKDGWFPFGLSQSTDLVSCYQIKGIARRNWMNASKTCERDDAELVSIETKGELIFLCQEIRKWVAARQNTPSSLVDVFIGLKREDYTTGRRFRWVSHMPLVYTLWEEGHPKNGISASCGQWTFHPSTSEDTTGLNLKHNTHHNNSERVVVKSSNPYGNWTSVGCGLARRNYLVCEINLKLQGRTSNVEGESYYHLAKPNRKSINKALTRGQLMYTDDNRSFVSLSASLGDVHELRIIKDTANNVININNLPKFDCQKNCQNQMIFYNFVCDFHPDCLNNQDEVHCVHRFCDPSSEFSCRSGECIPKEHQCDLFSDCRDGDDEDDCFKCQHSRCQDGRCLPRHLFGDGEVDCDTCSENDIQIEMNSTRDPNITDCVFTCNRTRCVYTHMLNNGIVDCLGPEGPIDESLGRLEPTQCFQPGSVHVPYANWAARCFYIKDRYGEPIGCRNMNHLNDCDAFVCPEGFYKCPESYCIPSHYLHNSRYDCPLGEDENVNLKIDCPGYFKCATDTMKEICLDPDHAECVSDTGNEMCLHPDHVCDGEKQCPHGDDELNCNIPCAEGLICLAGVVMASDTSICVDDISFISSDVRYLDLSGVDASRIFPAFSKVRFSYLDTAKLAGCNISSVETRHNLFGTFASLRFLDLSRNVIVNITASNVFQFMPMLTVLNLTLNFRLRNIESNAFRMTQSGLNIEELDLSFTGLQVIDWSVFSVLRKLKILNLRGTPVSVTPTDRVVRVSVLDIRQTRDAAVVPGMFRSFVFKDSLLSDSFKMCCPNLHNASSDLSRCLHPPDPFSSCSDLIRSVTLRVLLWSNGFLAVFGNVAVIFCRCLFNKPTFQNVSGQLVTHLAFSDLFVGLYLLVLASADARYRGDYLWKEMNWRHGVVCHFFGFLYTISCVLSKFILFWITLDRLASVKLPSFKIKLTRKVVVLVCVLTWLVVVAISLIPSIPFFEQSLVYASTGMCIYLPLISKPTPGWQFAPKLILYLNFALLILIAFGEIVIFKSVISKAVDQKRATQKVSRRFLNIETTKTIDFGAVSNIKMEAAHNIYLEAIRTSEIGSSQNTKMEPARNRETEGRRSSQTKGAVNSEMKASMISENDSSVISEMEAKKNSGTEAASNNESEGRRTSEMEASKNDKIEARRNSAVATAGNIEINAGGNSVDVRRKCAMEATRNISLVIVVDLCCWLPVGLLGLLSLNGYELSSDVHSLLAVLVIPLTSAINPILYKIPSIYDMIKTIRQSGNTT